MRLFEFDNPLRTSLIAVVGKLSDEIKSGDKRKDWTVDEFLNYLKDHDVDELDETDFYSIIKNKKPPLSSYISAIKDGKIVWRGVKKSDVDTTATPEKKAKTVQQMAKSALKK